jgi:DNA-binding NtrC family response regulator
VRRLVEGLGRPPRDHHPPLNSASSFASNDRDDLDSVERATIKQTLAMTRGNKVRAARMLGISHSTLYEKLKRYG